MSSLRRTILPLVPGGPDRRPPGSDLPACHGSTPTKSFTRRTPDTTAPARAWVQTAFLLLNVWIGVQFYAWVRFYETGGQSLRVSRPAGVEGWLPIAALMKLRFLWLTGELPKLHAAGLFLLVAFLAITVLVRKAFCSWLCPIGTLSEWLWQAGHSVVGRTWALPRGLDVPLRGLKYVLMGLFVAAVGGMTADALQAFLASPYGLVADVKMLDFFRHMGWTAALVVFGLLLASVCVKNPWCRYLCPYGALLGLVSLLSPARIRRNSDACIDCAKCAVACPSRLPVDRLRSVQSAECTACLTCVAACPAKGALEMSWGPVPALRPWVVAVMVLAPFVLLVGYARLTGQWATVLPDALLFELVPRATRFGHP